MVYILYVYKAFATRFARSLITLFGDRSVGRAKLDPSVERAESFQARPQRFPADGVVGGGGLDPVAKPARPPGPHLHSDVAVLAFATLWSPSALVALRA